MAHTQPDVLANTERISLVSSMIACLLIGDYAAIDASDACGMNLVDFRKNDWSTSLLDACATKEQPTHELARKLGPVAWSHAVCGNLASYFVSKYGMHRDCSVVASTGDNPSTVAGLQLENPGDVVISMGTSDTVLAVVPLDKAAPSGDEGHVLRNPIDPATCMLMLCYKNGSVTREKVRKNAQFATWDAFNDAIKSVPAACNGNISFHFKEAEITPRFNSTAVFRFDGEGKPLASFPSVAVEARAAIEGQFMSMRQHIGQLGLRKINRVIATGGASVNTQLLQVMASVFGCEVFVAETGPNTAALGAAYRALQGCASKREGLPSDQVIPLARLLPDSTRGLKRMATPDAEEAAVYNRHLKRYAELESRVLSVLPMAR